MGSKLFEAISLFNCSHQFSWPRRNDDGEYYQVCLVCGVEYQYDWSTMRRTKRRPRTLHEIEVVESDRKPPRSHRSWRPRERRLKWAVAAEVRKVGTPASFEATVENISRTGVLFRCAETLERGTHVEIRMEMPEEVCGQPGAIVLCSARVARASAGEGEDQHRIACVIEDYSFVSVQRAAAQ